MDALNSTPIYLFGMRKSFGPPKSVEPIITPSYELRPCLINMIRDKPFSGEGNENPYLHLREFEQTCACLHIAGMSDKTLRWKLFPFSLIGRAKRWYNRAVGSMQGDWETLCSEFCLYFFPIHRVVNLRKEVLTFRQLEQESLSTSWDRFNELVTSGPDLGFPDPVLIQHFYLGLTKNSRESLDLSSGGAFSYLPISKARAMINKVAQANSELLQ